MVVEALKKMGISETRASLAASKPWEGLRADRAGIDTKFGQLTLEALTTFLLPYLVAGEVLLSTNVLNGTEEWLEERRWIASFSKSPPEAAAHDAKGFSGGGEFDVAVKFTADETLPLMRPVEGAERDVEVSVEWFLVNLEVEFAVKVVSRSEGAVKVEKFELTVRHLPGDTNVGM